MSDTIHPILAGKHALVVGVANEHSIAWGCALAPVCNMQTVAVNIVTMP